MVEENNATFNYSTDRARIAELEAENAALREFVAAADEWDAVRIGKHHARRLQIAENYHSMRWRLAAEHGLPLPEVER